MNGHNYNLEEIAALFESSMNSVFRRVVYMKPNHYSDEALAVGVVIKHSEGFEFEYVSSVSAYNALSCFYGSESAEQLSFALNVLKSQLKSKNFDLYEDKIATNLLNFGLLEEVKCEDPKRYARDYLVLASSLYRTYECASYSRKFVGQDEIRFDLFNSVSHIDTFRATRLFKGEKIKISTKKTIDIPIVGEHVFGAPVSFVTKKVGDAKTRAEAFIAKFNCVREQLRDKSSALYILMPTIDKDVNRNLVDDSIGELLFVGEANDVKIRFDKNVEELAKVLLKDDAA